MAETTKTIGIIGGGQLGLMIVEQAHLLGARTLCLDPAPDAPAFALSDGHIVAAYDDAAALEELCRRSDVVTYEFENVPGEVLIPLVERYNIPQGFQPLYDSQDRLREKRNAVAHVLDVCKKHGKLSVMFCGSAEAAAGYFAQGFTSVTVSLDISILIDAAKAMSDTAFGK